MEPAKRIIANTFAQYVKAAINIVLSLYSTRLILQALTVPDYGIYSVVGGVVAMLGFLTNALVITTQRYISYYHGAKRMDYVGKVFANSLFLHILIGVGICLTLLLFRHLIVFDVLNISSSRLDAANVVYVATVVMLFVSIVTAPYKALFIARENIVYISLVEVTDGVLKLCIAIMLSHVAFDRLITYSWAMVLILALNLLAYVVYSKIHFNESCIFIRFKDIEKKFLTQLLGFVGWTSYGMGAVAAKNQGVAVILNIFFGTLINAAYGIALQVYSAVSFVSTSVLNAMNPQIIKAEGSGNRNEMLKLAGTESKYSTALMAIVAVPIIIEMPSVLAFWLKDVPEYTSLFCRLVLVAFLCDQLTIGLNVANQALGDIKVYTLLTFTPKLLLLPLFYFILSCGKTAADAMFAYVGVELAVAIARIPYMSKTAGLDAWDYVKHNIVSLLPLFAVLVSVGIACVYLIDMPCRFVVTFFLSVAFGVVAGWFFSVTKKEKSFMQGLFKQKCSRHVEF